MPIKREKLRWPEVELTKKSILLNPTGKEYTSQTGFQEVSVSILKEIFNGTNGYNVLLHSKGEKKHLSSSLHKKHRKSSKPSAVLRSKERRAPSAPLPLVNKEWYLGTRCTPLIVGSLVSSSMKFPCSISVIGSGIGLSQRPKSKIKRLYFTSLQKSKPTVGQVQVKDSEVSVRRQCILSAIKPSNVEKERIKFFKSDFTYNPQFEYANPVSPQVLARHSNASDTFLIQAVRIMKRALRKYGSYEKFEQVTGGCLLTKSRIWYFVKKYMEKEDCLGDIAVHLTDDLLSRASMTIVNGRPTLTINVSTAREHWLEGMLRHEIGTHYLRGLNNNMQPWCNWNGRKKHALKPVNPTEEGLASIHSVLFRKDPFLWRAALLYYTVYKASFMSFSELFQDISKFVKDPNTRWDYCVRAKRGQTDTLQPGCFSKDQVYLDGILKILRHRSSINFQLLTALGKVSYEDIEKLKSIAMLHHVQIPHFLRDQTRYKDELNKIMEVNGLTDSELQLLV